MKETPVSICEKSFINACINENRRLDGRLLTEFRDLEILFGAEWGSVQVSLGDTRVLAQISCDVAQPKATRPNEGLLFINVDLGPMAAPHFEAGRSCDASIQINRILEKAFKDSRCIDLESLCIVAEEKVWNIRVDINILNDAGNIIDCASVATLAALGHFKRPDVTTAGQEVVIHTLTEKDPIPIVLHHFPVCVSFGVFNKGEQVIADPSAIEERIAEANIVFGLNSYRELCGLHVGGAALTSSDVLLDIAKQGAVRASIVTDLVKKALVSDEASRNRNESIGFMECIRNSKITSLRLQDIPIRLQHFNADNPKGGDEMDLKIEPIEVDEPEVHDASYRIASIGEKSALMLPPTKLGEGGVSNWIPTMPEDGGDTSSESEMSDGPDKT